MWAGFLSSQSGARATLGRKRWLFGSPCCQTTGRAGVSATEVFPWPCRSAQRPKERRARQRASAPC
eukprot:scaffold6196_cov113-Isochrysis_galbana.AAC.13